MYDVKVPENPNDKVVVIELEQPVNDNSYKEKAVFKVIVFNLSSVELYKEYSSVMKCYENQQEVRIIESEVTEAIRLMSVICMEFTMYDSYDVSMKAMIFHFEEIEYYVGVEVYRGVLEKIGVKKDRNNIYYDYDKVYRECAKRREKVKKKEVKR